ncbi:MAG: hypothetical protein OXJ64_17040, partial [Boseongicola sp.]|nr:hypothetical protein [Boseongicola sp.]
MPALLASSSTLANLIVLPALPGSWQLSAKQGVSGPCGTRESSAATTIGSWPPGPGAVGDVASGDAAIQQTEHRDQPKGTS